MDNRALLGWTAGADSGVGTGSQRERLPEADRLGQTTRRRGSCGLRGRSVRLRPVPKAAPEEDQLRGGSALAHAAAAWRTSQDEPARCSEVGEVVSRGRAY